MKDSKLWPSTDSSLLRNAKKNDAKAWEKIVEDYQQRLFAYVRRRGMSRQDAEEVVQEALTQLFEEVTRGRFKYQREKGKFRGLVAKMTRNVVWSMYESKKSERVIFDADELEIRRLVAHVDVWPQMEEVLESVIEELRNVMGGKGPRIVDLHWNQAMSHDEIAILVDESNGNVAKVIYRFRKRLIERMLLELGAVAR